MQVGLGASAVFIDGIAALEAIETQEAGDRMGFILGDQMRETPA
jgi:hypothetical protein